MFPVGTAISATKSAYRKPGSAPVFTQQSAPNGTTGVSYSYTFVAAGASFTLGSGTLPAGLSLSSGGVLSGTPTTATNYTFTVLATNGNGSTSSTSQGVTIAAGSGSAITSSVLASRTGGAGVAGVAPLYVHFDASGTTSSDGAITNLTNGGTFRQITHAFDFGDTGSGTWVQTGNSRNSHSGGPITAHVFETPGTYTVNVTHSHAGTGNRTATPIVITVSDPDTVYAGTATVCIEGGSVTGAGGPSGCAYFATLSAAGGLQASKRYLFKRGQTHSTSLSTSASNIRVGAYGAGAKPIITTDTSISGTNVCVRDVEQRQRYQQYGQHCCAMSVDMRVPNVGTGAGMFQIQESQEFATTRYQCFWECSANDTGGGGGYGLYGTACYVAVLGMNTQRQFQHDIRLTNHYKTCIQNCYLQGINPDGTQTAIKAHAANSGSSPTIWNESSAGICASEKLVIANNRIGSSVSPINWYVNCDPQNDVETFPGSGIGAQPEGVQDVIVENNAFTRGTTGSPQDVLFGMRRGTSRGNTISGGTFQFATGVNSHNIPSGWNGPYFSS